ncbi:glucose 1-dehydrogenase [Nitrospirillum iridis]|uniref:NAD(P)-dependent dehydrogenase (Short-subunit alcohol dehydrogenase family) n=1 Tax=Nitrospirillum iridis TaxID=765888 RepID=A0A7X0B1M3_9PROT|nr:NAD(P)-dependent dehydrogenase (short-subunit alcohol dehydrogenase family) [Nitrospirillum iridis]
MAQELEGKVAIVTGGASGIGRATAERFVAEGAKVLIADINDSAGAALAAGLGAAARYQHADVSRADHVQALVDAAVECFGGLHIMFNNAGISGGRHPHFLDDDLEDFNQVIGINLFGVMAGTQRAARHMARNGGGVILNNASIAGVMAGQALMSYRASKAAVIHLTKCLAIDLAQYGIRVNCLVPGHIRTPIRSMTSSAVSMELQERIEVALKPVWDSNKPLKRDGVPEDVAQAALFLAGDRAAQITGAILPIDGGISAGDPVNHLQELLATQAAVVAGN